METHLAAVASVEMLQVSGPAILLSPDAAQTFGLALHELATNALKYGALAHGGSIHVSWQVDGETFTCCWNERGFAAEHSRRGFGTSVLARIVPHSLDGEAQIRADKDGFTWSLLCPASALDKSTKSSHGLS